MKFGLCAPESVMKKLSFLKEGANLMKFLADAALVFFVK